MACTSPAPSANESDEWYFPGNDTDYDFSGAMSPTLLERTEEILYKWVILVIVIFGIAGNLLNLTVLTSKSLSKNMGRMEMSAHIGLIALAVSDLMFCVVVMPKSFIPIEVPIWSSKKSINFVLIYQVYGDAVINVFETSSTWLTVSMAFSRYMAICHPFKARLFVGRTLAKINILIVFLASIIFNLPRFFMYFIAKACDSGSYRYYRLNSGHSQIWGHAYTWCHFIVGIVLPLMFMAFCNFFLIKEVRAAPSRIERQTTRGNRKRDNATHLLTLTLTLIVVLYIVLVSPAEFNNFVAHMVTIESEKVLTVYNFSVAVTNTLKTLNFAINFILYCAVNAHFRKVMRDLFRCKNKKKHLASNPSFQQTEYSRISQPERTYLSERNNPTINSSPL